MRKLFEAVEWAESICAESDWFPDGEYTMEIHRWEDGDFRVVSRYGFEQTYLPELGDGAREDLRHILYYHHSENEANIHVRRVRYVNNQKTFTEHIVEEIEPPDISTWQSEVDA